MAAPPPNLYAPPAADLFSAAAEGSSRPPAGDLDAALRGELRVRPTAVMREGWLAAKGRRLTFLLSLMFWGPVAALPRLVVVWAWLASEGVGLSTLISAPEVWPTLMGRQPDGVRVLLMLSSALTGALVTAITWSFALAHIGHGRAGAWSLRALALLPRLIVIQLVSLVPEAIALVVGDALSPWALTPADLALALTLVWAPPLIIDRDMGALDAVRTSARLLRRTAPLVIALGATTALGALLTVLTCGLPLVLLGPWWVMTLGAAWRQLAGVKHPWGEEEAGPAQV